MFISQAYAATDAVQHAVPFYETSTFWVAVAFVTFFVLFGKKMGGVIGAMLDDRAVAIQNQIEEATRLREEAQDILASYEKKQHEALKEAEGIVKAAKQEAERLAAEAAEQLDRNLKRSEQLATDRIAQAEAQAIADVKSMAVDVAMDAAKRILTDDISAAKANALIDDSIKGLEGKLN
ncbi:MAG: F0F1 ATP synthase subunit B [Rhodospirillaceae bacterium]|nr:MAG: F0F1 ATP synthase subunit B [Rhodospirillaceae bacterium]